MRYILFALMCLSAITLKAQDKLQFTEVNHTVNEVVRYKLYPTVNIWTFLKLDTKSGEITQVQYSLEDDEMEVYLGKPPKTIPSDAYVNGRFELYPTSNNWTFILLDQIDGDVYQFSGIKREIVG